MFAEVSFYFGEKSGNPCGKCDICLRNKEKSLNDDEFITIQNHIFNLLKHGSLSLNEMITKSPFNEQKVKNTLRFLSDNNLILMNDEMKFFIINKN
jgi:superfamily II DNA helicase RecQ